MQSEALAAKRSEGVVQILLSVSSRLRQVEAGDGQAELTATGGIPMNQGRRGTEGE